MKVRRELLAPARHVAAQQAGARVCKRGQGARAAASTWGWRSSPSANRAVKCSVAAVAAARMRTSWWASACSRRRERRSIQLSKPCRVSCPLKSAWMQRWVVSCPTKPCTSTARRCRCVSGSAFRPARSEFLRHCSPCGKLIDQALNRDDPVGPATRRCPAPRTAKGLAVLAGAAGDIGAALALQLADRAAATWPWPTATPQGCKPPPRRSSTCPACSTPGARADRLR